MSASAWIKDTLDDSGVPYQRTPHAESFTAQELAQQVHVSGHRVVKTVIVMADGRPLAVVLPASRKVLLPKLKRLLDANELRLANEGEIENYFADCDVGAVPPLRHWQGVDVVMDESMKVRGEILFPAGNHHEAILMPFREWFALVRPKVGNFTMGSEQPLEPDTYEEKTG